MRNCLQLLLLLTGAFLHAQSSPRTIHVFVALADNANQGIVPVPAKLGNGEDPEHNLYWGSAFGVKTFFSRSSDWTLLSSGQKPKDEVLERCVFMLRRRGLDHRGATQSGISRSDNNLDRRGKLPQVRTRFARHFSRAPTDHCYRQHCICNLERGCGCWTVFLRSVLQRSTCTRRFVTGANHQSISSSIRNGKLG
jgi:hypothetical protein